MNLRKTALTMVLAFALLSLSLQASAALPSVGTRPADLLAKYSSVRMQHEVAEVLLSKNKNAAVSHTPQGNFTGAKMVLKDAATVGTLPSERTPKAVAIVFDFAAGEAGDICPGTDKYAPIPASYFEDMLFGTEYDPYVLADFARYAVYQPTPTSPAIDAPTDRTLKNYLLEVSDGWITDFTGDVVRVTLPHPYSYYAIGQPYGPLNLYNANADYSVAEIISDAAEAADPLIDFSEYAVDGYLPNIFFIHAGSGAEWTGQPDIIWSHSWEYASAYCFWQYALTGNAAWITDDSYYDPTLGIEVDGVRINNYSIEPEVGGNPATFDTQSTVLATGPFPPDVGVYAHEYAHVLGAPDQYDYGYESEGTGIYSLMSSGSWTRYPNAPQYSGNTPVFLDAWSRIYLGFVRDADLVTVTERGTSASYTLAPAALGGGVLKLVVPGTNGSEYFLVENRQQVPDTFDMGLQRSNAGLRIDGTKIHGLAIYHVDENVLSRSFHRASEAPAISRKTEWNMSVDKANGEWHYGVSILQADGLWWLERGTWYYGNYNLYRTGNAFGPKTYPASSSYYTNFAAYSKGLAPNYSGVFVTDIVETVGGSVTFTAGIE